MRIAKRPTQSDLAMINRPAMMSALRKLTWTNYSEVVSMSSESTVEREPSYLTVAQLARRLQVSESTIYGWVDRDYIPFLIAGDLVRFDPIAIHNWMLVKPIANVKRSEDFER
jgi:excisionase family DNA binding protein